MFSSRLFVGLIAFNLLSGCAVNESSVSSITMQYERFATLAQIDALLSRLTQFKPEDILIVFDFNYTLMYPLIPCLHKYNIDRNKSEFKKIIKCLSHEQADMMLTQMMATQNQKLVSEKLSLFLKKYSRINFIVCSSSLEKNADAYLTLLNKNNIKITNHYNLRDFEFLDFPEYLSGRPVYKSGIIATNRNQKGEILVNFLKRISHQPKLIIFIDNNTEKLDEVKTVAKSLKGVKLVIVEYSEYKNKPIMKVSKDTFIKYWRAQVENFLRRSI